MLGSHPGTCLMAVIQIMVVGTFWVYCPEPLAWMTDVTSTANTLVSQVTPLLGIMPRESTQLQSTNTPDDIKEILGTRAFQRYVDTPIQTLDGIVVNQPKRFSH